MKKILRIILPIFTAFLILIGTIAYDFYNIYQIIDVDMKSINTELSAILKLKYKMDEPFITQLINVERKTLLLDFGPSFQSRTFSAFEMATAKITINIVVLVFVVLLFITFSLKFFLKYSSKWYYVFCILTISMSLLLIVNIVPIDLFIVVSIINFIIVAITIFIGKNRGYAISVSVFLFLLILPKIIFQINGDGLYSSSMIAASHRDYPVFFGTNYLNVLLSCVGALIFYYSKMIIRKKSLLTTAST